MGSLDQPGSFTLAARGEQNIELDYLPLEPGRDEGLIRYEVCGPRCGPEVRVRGEGAQAAVRLDPAAVDFGTVGIAQEGAAQVLVVNDGNQKVVVHQLGVRGSSVFRIEPRPSLPAQLEPGSSLALKLVFRPEDASRQVAELVVETNDPAARELRA